MSGKRRFQVIYAKSLRQFVYSFAEFDFIAESVTYSLLPFPFSKRDGELSFPELKFQLCRGLQTRGVIHPYYDD